VRCAEFNESIERMNSVHPVIDARLTLTACAAILTACTTSSQPPEAYLRLYGAIPESSRQFTICNLRGCEETTPVTLSNADWVRIDNVFSQRILDGEHERVRIATAIALFEQLVAEQAGTGDDQAGPKGMFRGTRQLDCIAETTNTTAYLLLLQQRGLMRRHVPRYPQHRGFMHGKLPHNTAVIEDTQTGERYAVDAYFHGNGVAPEIVPLREWLDGYKPGIVYLHPERNSQLMCKVNRLLTW